MEEVLASISDIHDKLWPKLHHSDLHFTENKQFDNNDTMYLVVKESIQRRH